MMRGFVLYIYIYIYYFKESKIIITEQKKKKTNTKIYRHEDDRSTIKFMPPNEIRVTSNFVLLCPSRNKILLFFSLSLSNLF